MSDISLRPYQQKFIDDVRNEFRQNHKRVVGVAPCGAGKTIMTGWMIRESARRGKRSIFFVHRHELIAQTSETFTRLDIPHGIISAGIPMQTDLPVQIASVQTLAKRLDKVPAPDFLICDECHHILAATYRKILDAYPDAYLLGVTATPQRMGGVTLHDAFDSMVQSLSVNKLIQLGNLTRFKYFTPDIDIDLSDVKTNHGDFDNHQLANVMINKKITGGIVEHYLKFAAGKAAICYCVNVEHSEDVAAAFRLAGVSAAHVDASTPKVVRQALVEDFRHGKINILCNAELFSEGFDVPGCQAVILARPTKSLTLYIQQAMRPLRPDPNDPDKVAVIIDHVKNCKRHGLPNFNHHWSLNPNTKKKIRCEHCKKMVIPVFDETTKKKICPICGAEFPKGAAPDTPPRRAEYENGSLSEIHVDFSVDAEQSDSVIQKPEPIDFFLQQAAKKNYRRAWAAFRALDFAQSYEDCLHIADVCGYKKGWAFYQWQELQDKKNFANKLQNALRSC